MTRGLELEREARRWMLISAASIVFCGSCLSIASVVLFYLASLDARRDALPEAALRLMWGKRITFIGVLLGAAGVLAALVIRLVAVSG
jgi:hypothetical protein